MDEVEDVDLAREGAGRAGRVGPGALCASFRLDVDALEGSVGRIGIVAGGGIAFEERLLLVATSRDGRIGSREGGACAVDRKEEDVDLANVCTLELEDIAREDDAEL